VSWRICRCNAELTIDSRQAETNPTFPPTFILHTVPTFFPPRKYIGIVDLPLTSLRFGFRIVVAMLSTPRRSDWSSLDSQSWKGYDNKGLFVSSLGTWKQNVHIFLAHDSQRTWDRWLYMVVSRYMWFNTVEKVDFKVRFSRRILSLTNANR
jgi:N-acetylglucosaminylphosphatidylinositol deacetylase